MWYSKRLISCLLIFFCFLFRGLESRCSLSIPDENKPLLTQTFGSKVIIVNKLNYVELDENDEIQAYCSTGFRTFNSNGYHHGLFSERKLSFKCVSDRVQIDKPGHVSILTRRPSPYITYGDSLEEQVDELVELDGSMLPSCIGNAYAMYESRHKLPNCDDELSYALGAKLTLPIITAGLCYDLENLLLKYVSYKLHEQSSMLDKAKQFYPEGLMVNSLTEPLKALGHLFKFPNAIDISNGLELQAKTNFWLQIASYDLDNIIQSSIQKSMFDEFKEFFNTLWWRNLRIGNWRRFMQLIEARSDNVTYNLYTGTSGKLRVPFEKLKCEKEESKELHLPKVNTRIPQFIWTYLQSTSENVVEDFVVIAYNSPYFEYFDRNSTVICNDMCDEIDWLQPMQDSRSISALGYFYCCRSDEVIGLLDGFPLAATNQTVLVSETPEPL